MTARWPVTAARLAARRSTVDHGSLATTVAFYLVVAGTMGTLWRVAAHGHGGQLAGYTATQLTWYLAASEAVTVCLNSRLIERVGDDIGSGLVAVEMLRPASVLGVRVSDEMGACLPRLLACATAGFMLANVAGGTATNYEALLLAVPAMVLAIACNIMLQHAVAAAAFWLRDARSSWYLYQKLVFILGGMLIPLQLLPSGLRAVCFVLPFAAMAYVPARLASGFMEPWLLVLQLGWLIVVSAAALAMFRMGERRLQVVGG
ncbi:MAG: transporter permease [Acidimicrobiia bacterium]|nr:transporter permease [Acidimicrobiia bacterium]